MEGRGFYNVTLAFIQSILVSILAYILISVSETEIVAKTVFVLYFLHFHYMKNHYQKHLDESYHSFWNFCKCNKIKRKKTIEKKTSIVSFINFVLFYPKPLYDNHLFLLHLVDFATKIERIFVNFAFSAYPLLG